MPALTAGGSEWKSRKIGSSVNFSLRDRPIPSRGSFGESRFIGSFSSPLVAGTSATATFGAAETSNRVPIPGSAMPKGGAGVPFPCAFSAEEPSDDRC